MGRNTAFVLLALAICWITGRTVARGEDWQPVPGNITTPWADRVDPAKPWPEYPRPQMVRPAWVNLNGLWDYAITAKDAATPDKWDGKILVPFCIESALSGVKKSVSPEQRLWYHRTFDAPDHSNGKHVTLNFEAVDWQSTVYLNGKEVGTHKGGYDPFSIDVTDALRGSGPQELIVSVWDPTDAGSQPRGKQVLKPSGIWYTAVTGIWQTVWLETVPATHIRSLQITPDLDNKSATITVEIDGDSSSATASAAVLDDPNASVQVTDRKGHTQTLHIQLAEVSPWSPDAPHLYPLTIRLKEGDSQDEVTSYFAMRKISFAKDDKGINRIFLNNRPLFLIGPLDQGWWPDGLYTAPTDEALKFDIETTRKLGLNMARKHVKVEPRRWYYWADKLGLLVWQDMPSGMQSGAREAVRRGQKDDITLPADATEQFKTELTNIINARRNHPCIVTWVPFNEGWGQHDTNEILKYVKQLDPSRLVDAPSGWEDRGFGDFKDRHQYPGPGMDPPIADRVSVLGEFGGLGLPIEGHLWVINRHWGYRNLTTREELESKYEELINQLPALIDKGLAAAVYTQTTDCEGEVNGLMTYDRKVIKLDAAKVSQLHRKLTGEPAPVQFNP